MGGTAPLSGRLTVTEWVANTVIARWADGRCGGPDGASEARAPPLRRRHGSPLRAGASRSRFSG